MAAKAPARSSVSNSECNFEFPSDLVPSTSFTLPRLRWTAQLCMTFSWPQVTIVPSPSDHNAKAPAVEANFPCRATAVRWSPSDTPAASSDFAGSFKTCPSAVTRLRKSSSRVSWAKRFKSPTLEDFSSSIFLRLFPLAGATVTWSIYDKKWPNWGSTITQKSLEPNRRTKVRRSTFRPWPGRDFAVSVKVDILWTYIYTASGRFRVFSKRWFLRGVVIYIYIHTYITYIHYITLHCIALHYITLQYNTIRTYKHTYKNTNIQTYIHPYIHTYIHT